MKSSLLISFVVTLAIIVMGCQPSPPTEVLERSPDQIQQDCDGLREQWQALANAGDFQSLAALYTYDAVLVDEQGNVHQGAAVIARHLEELLPTLSEYRLSTMGRVADGDLVAAYGSFAVTRTDSEEPEEFNGMFQTVSTYHTDNALRIRLHFQMLPPVPSDG